jgi:hypothetical protein
MPATPPSSNAPRTPSWPLASAKTASRSASAGCPTLAPAAATAYRATSGGGSPRSSATVSAAVRASPAPVVSTTSSVSGTSRCPWPQRRSFQTKRFPAGPRPSTTRPGPTRRSFSAAARTRSGSSAGTPVSNPAFPVVCPQHVGGRQQRLAMLVVGRRAVEHEQPARLPREPRRRQRRLRWLLELHQDGVGGTPATRRRRHDAPVPTDPHRPGRHRSRRAGSAGRRAGPARRPGWRPSRRASRGGTGRRWRCRPAASGRPPVRGRGLAARPPEPAV